MKLIETNLEKATHLKVNSTVYNIVAKGDVYMVEDILGNEVKLTKEFIEYSNMIPLTNDIPLPFTTVNLEAFAVYDCGHDVGTRVVIPVPDSFRDHKLRVDVSIMEDVNV